VTDAKRTNAAEYLDVSAVSFLMRLHLLLQSLSARGILEKMLVHRQRTYCPLRRTASCFHTLEVGEYNAMIRAEVI
jgi:hypothetical protein